MFVLYDGCRHRLPKGMYFKLASNFGGFKFVFCLRTALELRHRLPRGMLFKYKSLLIFFLFFLPRIVTGYFLSDL